MGSLAVWGHRPWGGPWEEQGAARQGPCAQLNAPEACFLRRDCGLTDQCQGPQPPLVREDKGQGAAP